jgi:hypothetical protein
MSFINKIWEFLKVVKKYWLLQIIILLVLFVGLGLIILSHESSIVPFIYKIF